MIESIASLTPFMGMATATVAILWFSHWFLIGRKVDLGNERKFPYQLIMLGLTIVGLLASVLVLPISESSRNQLIGLIGLAISGTLAFSSTTIISNLMAGILLRITKPFRVGDFIRVRDYFGRVSERGLFDTEIQTETRELIALPNIYFINNPVVTTIRTGTLVSATLSLGYDVDHNRVERLLIDAAQTCGLQEPFVHILELGNFAVTYRVSGLLDESKRLISVRSNLYGCVLDTLHSQGVEIMSPSYMNQRKLHDGASAIPAASVVKAPDEHKSSAEDIAFDKAEKAEELENEKQKLAEEIESFSIALKGAASEEEKKTKQKAIEENKKQLKLLEEVSDVTENQSKSSEPVTAPAGHSAVPETKKSE
ncbi:mechanosensitive ion channel family protein [Teredinibacter franksiae]|uniref:mechanosensitive ion channel family protein n=1 Tax=Teredinibacter franksiae TaxID=2761453 RepID=UPI00162714CE|nr:mechanosensitive ion channel domain-containing protein [Teredinibacter franksiae]